MMNRLNQIDSELRSIWNNVHCLLSQLRGLGFFPLSVRNYTRCGLGIKGDREGWWWWWWLTVVVVESSRDIFGGIAVSSVADNQARFANGPITNQDALDTSTVIVTTAAAAASTAAVGWWHVAVGILQLLTQQGRHLICLPRTLVHTKQLRAVAKKMCADEIQTYRCGSCRFANKWKAHDHGSNSPAFWNWPQSPQHDLLLLLSLVSLFNKTAKWSNHVNYTQPQTTHTHR